VPISRKIWIIFAINSSENFFLSPKMLNWPKIFFGDGGGRSPIIIWSKKKSFQPSSEKKYIFLL
jgi:hypothetical protein